VVSGQGGILGSEHPFLDGGSGRVEVRITIGHDECPSCLCRPGSVGWEAGDGVMKSVLVSAVGLAESSLWRAA
jgi:hypothetical protein